MNEPTARLKSLTRRSAKPQTAKSKLSACTDRAGEDSPKTVDSLARTRARTRPNEEGPDRG